MHSPFDNARYSLDYTVMLITFFVTDMKCGLYEVNKNDRANVTHGPNPGKRKCSETQLKSRTRTCSSTKTKKIKKYTDKKLTLKHLNQC